MHLSIWPSAWHLLSPQWAFAVAAVIILLVIEQSLEKQVVCDEAEGVGRAGQNPDPEITSGLARK